MATWTSRIPGLGRRPRIVLHIGAMKTGTTYLQALMAGNREPLLAAGFLFPGEDWTDQSRAVRDMVFPPAADPRVRARTEGKWDALVAEAAAHRGEASVVSMEFLSFADDERAAAVVASLADFDVQVVLTVRDAQRAVPAQWQTSCRNGGKLPYPRFVRGLRTLLDPDSPATGRAERMLQRTQGIPRMLDTWVPLVGADQVHVVTVPPSGSDPLLLWRRFAEVVGIPPEVVVDETVDANVSLGHASSELMRRINTRLGPVPSIDYWRVVKGQLGRAVLAARSDREDPVRLDERGLRQARRWNKQVRQAVRRHGVTLTGSPDDLPVGPPDPGTPATLPQPTDAELLDAAEDALAGLLVLRDRLCEWTVTAPVADHPVTDWRASPEPVPTAVGELVELLQECVSLNQRLLEMDPEVTLWAHEVDPDLERRPGHLGGEDGDDDGDDG